MVEPVALAVQYRLAQRRYAEQALLPFTSRLFVQQWVWRIDQGLQQRVKH
ncbi:hypothetical protein [Pseudomonas typographi]|nr:hypothetical protein [Pseudomonas typographi]MBD1588628.1 hypothetical protein [Pseudomonas typographi]